jgi:inner membrane protein YhjD
MGARRSDDAAGVNGSGTGQDVARAAPESSSEGGRFSLAAVDRYQREHGWLGFPLAVRQKYSDDGGGYLAAGITYYGFFALFPLLVVFISILGFVLQNHPKLQQEVVNTVLAQLPVIGNSLQLHALRGSWVALALGLVGSIWAGMGVFVALQNAVGQLWGIPHVARPNFIRARLHALVLMVALGAGLLASAALGSIATVGASYGLEVKLVTLAGSAVLNCLLFWVGFRSLSGGEVPWRSLRGGAIAAGLGYMCLQLVGGVYISHVLKRSSETYGTFALVVGLLTWIYLTAHITLLAVEGNVVASKRLWPRSLSGGSAPTPADERAWQLRAGVEQRREGEEVEVRVER